MTLTDLDTAILAALAPLKTGGTLRSVESASMPTGDVEDWLQGLGDKDPFAAVIYAGGSLLPLNPANGDYKHAVEYVVLAGVSAVRKPGNAATLNTVLAAILQALAGQTFSLAIKALQPTMIELVSMASPVLVYSIRFSTEFKWDLAEEAT